MSTEKEACSSVKEARFAIFDSFFSERPKDKRVCIVTHHTPDPDAIGSAIGLGWLLESQFGLQSDIFYAGEISHPQNQTEVNVLDVRLKQKKELELDKYGTFVTVDSVPENTGFCDIVDEWHAVFDHHQKEADTEVTDIRSVGACSTIIWDYIDHFGLDFDSEQGATVATALFFGIVSDTQQLLTENVCDIDRLAHSDLLKYIDRKTYQEIVKYPLPPYLYRLRALASENLVSEASILISYLGILTNKRRDALPFIADEFMRMEGIETVVIFCMIDGHIQASVRSQNSSVNVNTFCEKVFGVDYGGGKQGSGGAKVPIGFLYSPDDDDELQKQLSEFVQDTISKRIIRHLSGA